MLRSWWFSNSFAGLQAREDRKKALSELDNYKFETETEIWL